MTYFKNDYYEWINWTKAKLRERHCEVITKWVTLCRLCFSYQKHFVANRVAEPSEKLEIQNAFLYFLKQKAVKPRPTCQNVGDHGGLLVCNGCAQGWQKCWSGSRWHSYGQPTMGTFPCIQIWGKETKKRMCAGCSRSLWTMKEPLKTQTVLFVNFVVVSIHNVSFERLMARIQCTV